LAKALPPATHAAVNAALGARDGDAVVVVVGEGARGATAAGAARLLVAEAARRKGCALEPHGTAARLGPGEVATRAFVGAVAAAFPAPPPPAATDAVSVAAEAAVADVFWVTDFPL